MARKEARIGVTTWDDRDFTTLLADDQRWYFFLISQKDLTHAGVIPLRESRWAKSCADGHASLEASLARLEAARFIVVDRDEGELLVRSLMRRDEVYLQPNVMLSAVRSVDSIASPLIIEALFWEIARIEQLPMTANQAASVAKMVAALSKRAKELGIPERKQTPAQNPSANPSRDPSGNPSEHPQGEGGVVTVRTTDNPLPPFPFSPPAAAPPREPFADRRELEMPPPDEPPGQAERIIGGWLDTLRKPPQSRIVNDIGRHIRAALADGQDPADITEALRLWQAKGNLGPNVLPSLIHQIANGSSQPGTDLAIPGARASPRPSTTDARVADALALAAELEAMEKR